ncbi:thiol:disulfide interchange protein DsbA precursor [Buchnera aphidicola str. Bp (Baizongia pistaciae)]|uniref:Thiol:disulfide interchange protein DsbA n=1 Tax=Buchnera aphidicola subsp. Baizongia pistaciae (strain Bp) TaxID=224915 RepID=DSBA_BUCBP|nr:thiol:disulfide interchange protein DsbA [Buchnera aphidicola]Q89AD2.1 RecName: Full=Thiol:disulfide interchange protein DsbA; Flags: Precursor [Buchnera aphidicola str. Bp (Baizongia pistaciae)]AAO27093.1 thiol:disulfide interchange protein DsbA precursor [Buchnera aphidicola str. Bp (Baizongia pistaciae)]
MKNFWMLFLIILLGFDSSNKSFIEGKEYSKVYNKMSDRPPPIIEFFSFLCPYCYDLEKKYNINHYIHKKISKNLIITKYCVNLSNGEFEKQLQKIWAVSVIKKLEKKILIPIFEGIQKKHTITTIPNLINTFLKLTKMNKHDYDFISNSFVVKSFIYKQERIEKFIKLDRVPATIIKGKYIINDMIIQKKSITNFINKYIEIIQFLLNKKL